MVNKIIYRQEPPIPFTQAGYDKLLAQREELLQQRPQAVANLKEARETGDLSENGYYKEARARLSFIDGRVRHLDRLIKRAQIVKTNIDGIVQIGKTVTVDNGGNKAIYAIVGGYESNPSQGSISHLSPLGKALMGKKSGGKIDVSTPVGIRKFRIVKVV